MYVGMLYLVENVLIIFEVLLLLVKHIPFCDCLSDSINIPEAMLPESLLAKKLVT